MLRPGPASASLLQAGSSLVTFPEGTRSRDGRLMDFKKGPFTMAARAQARAHIGLALRTSILLFLTTCCAPFVAHHAPTIKLRLFRTFASLQTPDPALRFVLCPFPSLAPASSSPLAPLCPLPLRAASALLSTQFSTRQQTSRCARASVHLKLVPAPHM